MNKDQITTLNNRFQGKNPLEILTYFLLNHKGKIAFATSLGLEDQILTHMIADIDPEVKIFTLDTGRLFSETYELIERTNSRYGINMEVYFPAAKKVEKMVREKGINLFYKSVENRKLCCYTRKIEPLHRALEGFEMWITGLRKEQSVTRNDNILIEIDDNNHGRIKINPLINWTENHILEFIHKNNIPYNKLHDQGFPSIGCQPCTRMIEPGEDLRAGRWWWEMPEHKECGLHQR